MSKTIWIVNQYASTPETGIGGRHYYLARELSKRGFTVYVIASASQHLLRSKPEMKQDFEIQDIDGFSLVWVKLPEYREAHSKQRAVNWLLFPWKLRVLAREIPDKPDTVLVCSPSPFAFLGARRMSRMFGCRLVFEVVDIWPLTLTKIGGYSRKHPFIRLMQWIEDTAYRESDAVISNLKNAVEHMVNRGMDREKFSWIPNGFSPDEVKNPEPLRSDVVSELPVDKFIVGYTGTLGLANAMMPLLDAAECLKEFSDIVFVIVGDGKEKQALIDSTKKRDLRQVRFIAPIPKSQVQTMLGHFDVCYIGWLPDDLYRFGIGANKIPEYLYSGKPILHSFSGACDPVEEAQAGIRVPACDPPGIADAILNLYRIGPEARAVLGANGHRHALENYDYSRLADRISTVLCP